MGGPGHVDYFHFLDLDSAVCLADWVVVLAIWMEKSPGDGAGCGGCGWIERLDLFGID